MPITKSPYSHLKALEIYKLVREGKISDMEFGDWLVVQLVDAYKDGMSMGKKTTK